MIEVVYKEEKKKPVGNEGFFRIPRNIRQIGEADDDFKIYIEDYAYHYLDRMTDDVSGAKAALLLGQTNWSQGVSYVFIRSAFELKGMEADPNHLSFTEEVWTQAHRTAEEYFPDQDVVGWFLGMPECPVELTDAMYRAHMNYFAGNDRVFFLRESLDGEEVFFRYDDGKLRRQSGYYLYYERNETMQNFMIEENHNIPMESGEAVDDRAVKDFRKIISRKKEDVREEKQDKTGSYFMFATAAAALLLAFSLGTNYLSDYQGLQLTGGTVGQLISQVQSRLPQAVSRKSVKTQDTLPEGDRPAAAPEVSAAVTEEAKAEKKPSEAAADTEERSTLAETAKAEVPTDVPEESVLPPEEKSPSAQTDDPDGREAAASGELSSYRIRRGDTLTSISRAIYGDSGMIDAICRLNGITRDTIIYEGETILLP